MATRSQPLPCTAIVEFSCRNIPQPRATCCSVKWTLRPQKIQGGFGLDGLSTSEILQLMIEHEQFIDSQVEFWLTVTFATIVASFVGKSVFTKTMRRVATVLYLVASAVFISRMIYEAQDLIGYIKVLEPRGVLIDPPYITAVARYILIILGVSATIYFVNFSQKGDEN